MDERQSPFCLDSMVMATVLQVCVGRARPLRLPGGRTLLSGIGKAPVTGPVAVSPLGLDGDEQADLSIHGGLAKAVYAYPVEHMAFWREQRRAHGVSLFDETLPPGFVGENLTLAGLLESEVWVGDTLHFDGSDCVLRVTVPREPCGKLAAVMGYAEAARQMVREARCGFYLAVEVPGELAAGMALTLLPGQRALSIPDAIRARWARHRNG